MINRNVILLFHLVILITKAFGDEFDDSIASNQVLAEDGLELRRKNNIETATVVPEQDNQTKADYETPGDSADELGFTETPEIYDESNTPETQTEKATWQINQYMPGCDHEVRDCFDAAVQLNNPEGHDKDTFLFDCMEAHDCTPLKQWACDSNINFVNRHDLLTERCLKWEMYRYEDELEQEHEAEQEQEVDREL